MSKEKAIIIGAMITGIFACFVAIIGLGLPFAEKMANGSNTVPALVEQENSNDFKATEISLQQTSVALQQTQSALNSSSPSYATSTPPANSPVSSPATSTTVPTIIPSPIITQCPSPSSYAINTSSFGPSKVVVGPATIHPFEGTGEIAKAIGLDWVPRWGINILSGQSVTIPASVTLLSGSTYIPEGTISYFTDDARIEDAQRCWLLNNP